MSVDDARVGEVGGSGVDGEGTGSCVSPGSKDVDGVGAKVGVSVGDADVAVSSIGLEVVGRQRIG